MSVSAPNYHSLCYTHGLVELHGKVSSSEQEPQVNTVGNTLVLVLIGYSSTHLPPWLGWEGRAATEGIDASMRGAWEQPAVEVDKQNWAHGPFCRAWTLTSSREIVGLRLNNHEPLFNPCE